MTFGGVFTTSFQCFGEVCMNMPYFQIRTDSPINVESFRQKCQRLRFGKVHDLVLRHPLQFEGGFPCVRPWVRSKICTKKDPKKMDGIGKPSYPLGPQLSHYGKKSLPQAKFMCQFFFGGSPFPGFFGSDIGEVNHLPKRAIRCTGVKKRWEKSSAINRHMEIYIYINLLPGYESVCSHWNGYN